VEALTAGLAGHGRADPPEPMGASLFLQILDPEAFSGGEAFRRQMGWVAEACLNNPPRAGFEQVRLPGQKGLLRREQQLRDGIELHAAILPALAPWANKFGIALLQPRRRRGPARDRNQGWSVFPVFCAAARPNALVQA